MVTLPSIFDNWSFSYSSPNFSPSFLPDSCLKTATQIPNSKYGPLLDARPFWGQLHEGFRERSVCTHSGSLSLCSASLRGATWEPLHALGRVSYHPSPLLEHTALLANQHNILLSLYLWHLPFLEQILFPDSSITQFKNAPSVTQDCPLSLSSHSEGGFSN